MSRPFIDYWPGLHLVIHHHEWTWQDSQWSSDYNFFLANGCGHKIATVSIGQKPHLNPLHRWKINIQSSCSSLFPRGWIYFRADFRSFSQSQVNPYFRVCFFCRSFIFSHAQILFNCLAHVNDLRLGPWIMFCFCEHTKVWSIVLLFREQYKRTALWASLSNATQIIRAKRKQRSGSNYHSLTSSSVNQI